MLAAMSEIIEVLEAILTDQSPIQGNLPFKLISPKLASRTMEDIAIGVTVGKIHEGDTRNMRVGERSGFGDAPETRVPIRSLSVLAKEKKLWDF
jgi:hypothetical protein